MSVKSFLFPAVTPYSLSKAKIDFSMPVWAIEPIKEFQQFVSGNSQPNISHKSWEQKCDEISKRNEFVKFKAKRRKNTNFVYGFRIDISSEVLIKKQLECS